MRRLAIIALLLFAGCAFNPDLSRFPLCDDAGQCASGSSCLTEEQRCVPSCGEHCEDAGIPVDGGEDASVDAGVDAGMDAGVDAGPELALAAATLPAAIETRPYAHTFMPTGGDPDGGYFFVLNGVVPAFTLGTDGTLSTSAAPDAGTFPFSITVRDAANTRVMQGFSLEVRPFLRVASQGSLVEGRQGQPYTEQLWATGGSPPYRWVVDGGVPPTGLTLTPDGGFVGSPSALGNVTFGVTVSDSATPPQQASRTLSIDVNTLDTLLTIATRAAADGRVGTPYSQKLKGYGGTQPYSWSVFSGSLPPGVMLTNTGTVGELSGSPTMTGRFDFTMKCADTLTSQTQSLRITVY